MFNFLIATACIGSGIFELRNGNTFIGLFGILVGIAYLYHGTPDKEEKK